MKSLRLGFCALAILAAEAGTAAAAWNNVFQATFFGRHRRRSSTSQFIQQPVVAQSAPVIAQSAPANNCCPQQQCTTRYIQRCYYQPVTTYQQRSYYQQVTSYRTSYYYEPCTSYRYSCYYDPCTCSYRQVAVPQTSYRLRAKQCPVTAYVQRCMSVPVTSYVQRTYYQPVTTCCQTQCTTTMGAAVATPPAGATTTQPPTVTQTPPPPTSNTNPPNVYEQPQQNIQQNIPAPPPQGSSTRGGGLSYPRGPSSDGYNRTTQYRRDWRPSSQTQQAFRPVQTQQTFRPVVTPPAQPPVTLDRVTVTPSTIDGRVVRSDNTPRPNARVYFVRADNGADSQTVKANSAGRFQVSLASGRWLVYLNAPDGTRMFHSRIDVDARANPRLTLIR